MIEKLREYEQELAIEKAAILAQDDSAAIEEEVAAFRAKVVAEYAQRKADKVQDLDWEIRAVERLIERELAKPPVEVDYVVGVDNGEIIN